PAVARDNDEHRTRTDRTCARARRGGRTKGLSRRVGKVARRPGRSPRPSGASPRYTSRVPASRPRRGRGPDPPPPSTSSLGSSPSCGIDLDGPALGRARDQSPVAREWREWKRPLDCPWQYAHALAVNDLDLMGRPTERVAASLVDGDRMA